MIHSGFLAFFLYGYLKQEPFDALSSSLVPTTQFVIKQISESHFGNMLIAKPQRGYYLGKAVCNITQKLFPHNKPALSLHVFPFSLIYWNRTLWKWTKSL